MVGVSFVSKRVVFASYMIIICDFHSADLAFLGSAVVDLELARPWSLFMGRLGLHSKDLVSLFILLLSHYDLFEDIFLSFLLDELLFEHGHVRRIIGLQPKQALYRPTVKLFFLWIEVLHIT